MGEGYKYEQPSDVGENYLGQEALRTGRDDAISGWYYLKNENEEGEGEFTPVEITDELIEVAQQAAIWYYTNYKDENNNSNNEKPTFDVKTQGLKLKCLDYETHKSDSSITQNDWKSLETIDEYQQGPIKKNVGRMLQDQATLLCWYLIDAANKYAPTGTEIKNENAELPLKVEQNQLSIKKVNVQNADCYVIGPIQIKEQTTSKNYKLNEDIKVKLDDVEKENSGAYISTSEGQRLDSKKLSEYVGNGDLYISIPVSSITKDSTTIKLEFGGTYNTNEKKLWICSTNKEQPVVEVTPKTGDFTLNVTGEIPKEKPKSLDLALRKTIVKVTDKKGTQKPIINEEGKDAEREITCETTPLKEKNDTTAIYKHRKDPVVVQIGDKVTYEITIYNEGEANGYAKTIVDQLPDGLTVKQANGTCTTKDKKATYSYSYVSSTNQITFTRQETSNYLTAYAGNDELSQESIQIECEVTGTRPKNTNQYYTNIAYITGKHNSDTNADVDSDIDSDGKKCPSESNLKPTGEKYNGYHGGNGAPSDAYQDTNNQLYFKGQEDDDDFEVVVVKPKAFDLALQKYISKVNSNGVERTERTGPTINTQKLASGEKQTAEYTFDENKPPVKVKHGDFVTYTFTVYNEGDVDGYVDKITDNIPSGLQFVIPKNDNADDNILYAYDSNGDKKEITVEAKLYQEIKNINKHWTLDKKQGQEELKTDSYNNETDISITCDVANYLKGVKSEQSNKLLLSYNKENDTDFDGKGLDSVSVTVILRVSADNKKGVTIRNEAAITEAEDDQHTKQGTQDLKDRDSETDNWQGKNGDKQYQDDEDYDNIYLGNVDLALKKFIIAVSEDDQISDGDYLTPNGKVGDENNPYERAPKVNTTKLKDDPKCTDATYTMVKKSIIVPKDSYVLYNIRVYNEGETDVYAGEITDYLPTNLEYVTCQRNTDYGWTYHREDYSVTTSYLSKEKLETNLLKAFDKQEDEGSGEGLHYKDLQVLCKVKPEAPAGTKFINTAEITKYQYENGETFNEDVDSQPKNVNEKNKEKNEQDDDDYEVVEVKETSVDLALTKFIIAVSEDDQIEDGEYLTENTKKENAGSKENPYIRQTSVDTSGLRENVSCHDAKYEQVKTSLQVPEEAYVLYNIRVYNEGETDVYAGEVADYLPDYLEFVKGEENNKYGWTLDDDDVTVRTSYLSKTNGEDKILKAFDKENDDGKGSGLDYKDLPILCKLKPITPENTKLINTAEITKYEDENGEEIPKDVDSEPKNVEEKNKEDRKQDDDDYEVVEVKKLKFDLALRKYITNINFRKVREEPKINTKDLSEGNSTTADYELDKNPIKVKQGDFITYTFTVYNEGEKNGYVDKITDNIPKGLQFVYNKDREETEEYTLIARDSEGNMEEIKVGADIYSLVESNNSCWSINTDENRNIVKDKYNEEDDISITCDVAEYLANKYPEEYEGQENKLLKAYDSQQDVNYDGKGLDRVSVTVVLRVNSEDKTGVIIRNEAAITEAEDEQHIKQDVENLEDRDSQINEWPGKDGDKNYQDDEDYDNVFLETVDLALTKFIIAVSEDDQIENGEYLTQDKTKEDAGSEKNPYTRQTRVNTSELKEDITCHDAKYEQVKKPLQVPQNAYVLYNIRVYNEGDTDVYAGEVIDYLPDYLEFVKGEENNKYGWTLDDDDVTVRTSYLSKTNGEDKILKAFDKEKDDGKGLGLYYKDLPILCKVRPTAPESKKIINTAEITKYEDENGTEIPKDVDSEPENVEEKNKEDREQDDDDYEVVEVEPLEFDLALRKYITNINSKNVREEPKINTKDLAEGKSTTADYELDKTPIKVKQGDFITYTFTVYNEGEKDGYVDKITDNIPKGLQFVYNKDTSLDTEKHTLVACDSEGNMEEIEVAEDIYNLVENNNSYWSIDTDETGNLVKDTYNGEENISVTCDVAGYLANKYPDEYGEQENKLLKAYDSKKDTNYDGTGLDRVSVTVVLRVNSKDKAGVIIRNEAAITEAEDEQHIKQDVEDLIDRDSQINEWPGKDGDKNYQDDEDYDNVFLGSVDLALTKFITAISKDINIEDGEYLTRNTTSKDAGKSQNPYTRQTVVDTRELRDNEECHDATYTQVKTSLVVPQNAYILYNIRVYNEGDTDVYAGEITDYLPEYLDFVEGEFNTKYGWQVSEDGRTVKTSYLSHENGEENLLKAFNKETDNGSGSGLDYRDIQILCKINEEAKTAAKLINTAEITKYEDDEGEDIPDDVDSTPDNKEEKNTENKEEDDDDYEVVEIEEEKVDLALTKFIMAVSNDINIEDGEYLTQDGNKASKENPYLRATKVDTTELRDNEECHDATYTLVKEPLSVPARSYVLYNIRVYNEGETNAYAGEVTDHLPDYLDYIECDFNKSYGWEVDSDGKTIRTKYLSSEKGEDKLLKAFNKVTDNGAGSGLDYQDLQVLCRVNDNAPTKTQIINIAEITKYEDEEGDEIPKDEDSTPDNVDKKSGEDDDDYEIIEIKTFDLNLLKYVSKVYVTEDGNTKEIQTGNNGNKKTDIIPKVEINKRKMDSTVVKFEYVIKITNEGEIEGYAKEITDYVPEGLKFYEEDNQGWTDEGNNVISTKLLENTLLKPGESAEVTVIFRWINGKDNLNLKTNIAEISEDYNEYGVPDRDSTPDNQKEGEDDIDDASVMLSISTGLLINIIKYVGISLVIIAVLGSGILIIKRYVL